MKNSFQKFAGQLLSARLFLSTTTLPTPTYAAEPTASIPSVNTNQPPAGTLAITSRGAYVLNPDNASPESPPPERDEIYIGIGFPSGKSGPMSDALGHIIPDNAGRTTAITQISIVAIFKIKCGIVEYYSPASLAQSSNPDASRALADMRQTILDVKAAPDTVYDAHPIKGAFDCPASGDLISRLSPSKYQNFYMLG